MLAAYGVHGLGDVFEDEVEVELVLFFALLGGVGKEDGDVRIEIKMRAKMGERGVDGESVFFERN